MLLDHSVDAFLDPMPHEGMDSYEGLKNEIEIDRETWLESCLDATGPTGLYWVSGFEAICDTVTDGGGWTLVYSGSKPPYDFGGPWYDELKTLRPNNRGDAGPRTLWWELHLSPSVSDFRASCTVQPCRDAYSCNFTVDLAFYDTMWYNAIASGKSDQETCFGPLALTNRYIAPRRCNLVSGECTSAFWSSGEFEGEKSCDALEDFTVDFNDRGMDSNESDGTDWGLDDNVWKCGARACDPTRDDCAWFVWVRRSTKVKDLFERIFGVRGWTQALLFLFGVWMAACLPMLALGCARCCFRCAVEMSGSTFAFDHEGESGAGAGGFVPRPSHSESNYPHYVMQTKAEHEEPIDEEDDEMVSYSNGGHGYGEHDGYDEDDVYDERRNGGWDARLHDGEQQRREAPSPPMEAMASDEGGGVGFAVHATPSPRPQRAPTTAHHLEAEEERALPPPRLRPRPPANGDAALELA